VFFIGNFDCTINFEPDLDAYVLCSVSHLLNALYAMLFGGALRRNFLLQGKHTSNSANIVCSLCLPFDSSRSRLHCSPKLIVLGLKGYAAINSSQDYTACS